MQFTLPQILSGAGGVTGVVALIGVIVAIAKHRREGFNSDRDYLIKREEAALKRETEDYKRVVEDNNSLRAEADKKDVTIARLEEKYAALKTRVDERDNKLLEFGFYTPEAAFRYIATMKEMERRLTPPRSDAPDLTQNAPTSFSDVSDRPLFSAPDDVTGVFDADEIMRKQEES